MTCFKTFVKDETAIKIYSVGDYQSNCTLITDLESSKTIIIDPGFDGEYIWNEIKSNNLIITKILHTHAHFDHAGHSTFIQQKTKAPLYMHQGDMDLYNTLHEQGKFFGRNIPKPAAINTLLEENDLLQIDEKIGPRFKVISTPGHTQGCCCFYTEDLADPMLIAGDTLFRLSIGRTDLPGGDYNQIIHSIKNKLFVLPENTIVVTGHGPLTNIGDEKKSNPFLQ